MNKIFLLITFLIVTATNEIALADEVNSAKILRVRSYTGFQQENARNFTIFTINKNMIGGCNALFISAIDKEALSVLLMAKAQNLDVLVGYNQTQKAPWESSTCQALHIEIM